MALLPAPLNRRVRHVLEENKRVEDAVTALRHADMPALARLLNASHASLRDLYEVSVPELEDTVTTLKAAGAAGHAFRWRLRRLGPRLVPAPGPDPPERHPGHSGRPRTADPHDGRTRHRRERVSERAGSARGVDPRPVNHAGKAQDRDLEARPVMHCGSALQQRRYLSWELREASPLRES